MRVIQALLALLVFLSGAQAQTAAQGPYKQIAQALYVAKNVAPVVCPAYQTNTARVAQQMYIANITDKDFDPGGSYGAAAQEVFDFYTESGRRNNDLTCRAIWSWLGDSGQQLIQQKR
jgi:hypothetical protein